MLDPKLQQAHDAIAAHVDAWFNSATLPVTIDGNDLTRVKEEITWFLVKDTELPPLLKVWWTEWNNRPGDDSDTQSDTPDTVTQTE